MKRPWAERAACRGMDPEVFFVPEPDRVPPEAAAVCDSCPVHDECLDWALAHEHEGVWAGTSPSQRRRMRKHKITRLKHGVRGRSA